MPIILLSKNISFLYWLVFVGQQQGNGGNGAYALCDFLLGAVTARGVSSRLPPEALKQFEYSFKELERHVEMKTPVRHVLLTKNETALPTIWGVSFDFEQHPPAIVVPLTRRLHSLVERGTYHDPEWNGEGKFFLDLETGLASFDGYQRTEPPLTHHPLYVGKQHERYTLDQIAQELATVGIRHRDNGKGYTM